MQALNSVLSLTFGVVKTVPNQFADSVFFYKKTLKQFEEPKMNNLKFLSIKNVELGSSLWNGHRGRLSCRENLSYSCG